MKQETKTIEEVVNFREEWKKYLVCPIDKVPFKNETTTSPFTCEKCGFQSAIIENLEKEKLIEDFRAKEVNQEIPFTFKVPMEPINVSRAIRKFFYAIKQDFPHIPREEIRQQFGTKLDKSIQFYCQKVFRDFGPKAKILDLGCGNGGNKRYLKSLGFKNILSADYNLGGAEVLVDAHRLPFTPEVFDMVLATSVLEHMKIPFLAVSEISRVLKEGGCFLGDVSFWEAWHDASSFHLTPDGWHSLCEQTGLTIEDMWPGWGVIPPLFSMVFTPGQNKLLGYQIQAAFEENYRNQHGEDALRLFQLKVSGSLGVYLVKKKAAEIHEEI